MSVTEKLYTTGEMAEMFGIGAGRLAKMRISSVIYKNKIKHVKRGAFIRCGNSERFDSRTRLFDIDAVNKIRVHFLKSARRRQKRRPPAIRLSVEPVDVAAAAARGEHDAEGIEFLKAVDKFKNDKHLRYLKVSDYLAILKSLGYRKITKVS